MGIQINGQTDTVTATDGSINVGGDVTIPGVLTYEDVTNVDSVGIVTAQSGIHVTGGSVGIGTDNPLRKLDILGTGRPVEIGSTNAVNIVKLYNSATGRSTYNGVDIQSNSTAGGIISAYGGYLDLRTSSSNGSDTTSRLRITSGGSVGIGTDNPLNGLDILQGNGRTRVTSFGHIITQNHNNSTTNYWSFAPRDGGEFDIGYGSPDGNGTVSSDKVTITSAGQVGVGTNVPNASLHIHNNAGASYDAICLSSSPKRQNLIRVNGADNLIVSVDEDNQGSDSQFRLQIDGSEKLRAIANGSIGINTTAPQSKLEVFTDDDTDFGDSSNTNNTNSLIRLFNKNGTDNTAVNNYVGIRFDVANGATSSAWLSYVRTGNNTGAFQFKARNAASSYPEVARILSSGGITFRGDTAQANALNDYEEGTLDWRLQRTGSIGSGSNHNDTTITYTKVGNRVYVSGYIYTANTSNSTGVTVELRDNSNTNNVATLPYVPNHHGGFSITGTRTIDDSYRNMAVTFRSGQSQVYIYKDDGDNDYIKNKNNVNISSNQTHLVIQFCGSYTTSS